MNPKVLSGTFVILLVVSVVFSGVLPTAPVVAQEPDPYALVSAEALMTYLTDLVNIQPYSGWRNAASAGEAEALDYAQDILNDMGYLDSLGLELERQIFNVYVATEIWNVELQLTVDGRAFQVNANSPRGSREHVDRTIRIDSDGVLNDDESNPQVIEGEIVIVRTPAQINQLADRDLTDKIVFVDYAIFDSFVGDSNIALASAYTLLNYNPAGIVAITEFSNELGVSHGTGLPDISVLVEIDDVPTVPLLYAQLEDLAPAGITSWEALETIDSVRLVRDVDVFAPGTSGNLIAHIPGEDSSRAVILGAHIDSPNTPGALDNGSGSAILLEVARVLNTGEIQPPVDVYLVWFGSEEIGLYGSSHFAVTHQELLDRTIAMFNIDCLTAPLDGVAAQLNLNTWSYSRMGNSERPIATFFQQWGAERGIELNNTDAPAIASDNSSFAPFDVPHVNLIYTNFAITGGVHYAGHLHSPYDDLERLQNNQAIFLQMGQVALAAALETGTIDSLRVTPEPDKRLLIIASQNESVNQQVLSLIDFSMTFSILGFDVDLIPFGQAVTAEDLDGADVVLVMPVLDYPAPESTVYDVGWSEDEVGIIENYVAEGGFLILTNIARRTDFIGSEQDLNEDWEDMNVLSQRFGVHFTQPVTDFLPYDLLADTALLDNVTGLTLGNGTAVKFTIDSGATLVGASAEEPLIAGLGFGEGGLVLAVGDFALFTAPNTGSVQVGPPQNIRFWFNLARFAALRE